MPDLRAWMPHRPPMLLVERVLSTADDGGVAEARFAPDGLFARADGAIDEAVHFELIAQTFAACMAVHRGAAAEGGFLASVRALTVHGAARTAHPVRIHARATGRVDAFVMVEGAVSQADRPLASGQLTVYAPPDVVAVRRGDQPEPESHVARVDWGAYADGALSPAATAPASRFFRGVEKAWRQRFRVTPDFPLFAGHFPGRPVLPALALVMLARHAASTLAGHALAVEAIPQAKFLSPVEPGATLDVRVAPPSAPGGAWKCAHATDRDVAHIALLLRRL